MRSVHRSIMLFAAVFLLYIGATGTIVQMIDLRNIYSNAPASDPDMLAIQDGLNGPANFQVLSPADYTAATLPSSLDATVSIATVTRAARTAVGDLPFDYVELRMAGNEPVGQVLSSGRLLTIGTTSGVILRSAPVEPIQLQLTPTGARDTVKNLHQMTNLFGNWAKWFQLASGLALLTLVITGLLMYANLLRGRFTLGRKGLIWSGGGIWRTLHRVAAILASLFLSVVAISGIMLTLDGICGSLYAKSHGIAFPPTKTDPLILSAASPLVDRDLPMMMDTTLASFKRELGDTPIRVIRLRFYAGIPQGVVITDGKNPAQLVFNALTGASEGLTEKNYPQTPFPFGWAAHETFKKIHRGDYFGLTGRWMDLLSGISLLFLTVSGLVMYGRLLKGRWNLGRRSLFWK